MKILPASNYQTQKQNHRKQDTNFGIVICTMNLSKEVKAHKDYLSLLWFIAQIKEKASAAICKANNIYFACLKCEDENEIVTLINSWNSECPPELRIPAFYNPHVTAKDIN